MKSAGTPTANAPNAAETASSGKPPVTAEVAVEVAEEEMTTTMAVEAVPAERRGARPAMASATAVPRGVTATTVTDRASASTATEAASFLPAPTAPTAILQAGTAPETANVPIVTVPENVSTAAAQVTGSFHYEFRQK